MNIEKNKEYFGEKINQWKIEHHNKYVITGLQQSGNSISKIGRVIQVRIDAGEFGSDNVLLRHCDDSLVQHSNQSFWLIPNKFNSYFDEIFKKTYQDEIGWEYHLGEGKEARTGFIIPSEIKEGQSTPMRDIKNSIGQLLTQAS